MKRWIGRFAALALLTTSMPEASWASSCVNAKTVNIQFSRGQRCWRYDGDATHFAGTFGRGQRIIASSTGIANFGNGKQDWKTTDRRELGVTMPGGSYRQIDSDSPEFVAPRVGKYTFDFSPCAMWRATGTFIVCAF